RGAGPGPRRQLRGLPSGPGGATRTQAGEAVEAGRRGGAAGAQEAEGPTAEGGVSRPRDYACTGPPRVVAWRGRQAAASPAGAEPGGVNSCTAFGRQSGNDFVEAARKVRVP